MKGVALELDSVILSLYIIPAIICFRTFQMSSEYYDQLPEKIPMHFDLRGQADKWWKKSRFCVYLLPAIGAGTLLMMGGVLLMIYRESGPLPDDFNFAFFFFTFSLTYLFYKTQIGIIRYALKEINNIWPFMGVGLSLVVISSVLLAVLPFIPTKPTLSDAIMCSKMENKTPIDARNTFSMNDRNVILFLKLGNIKGKHLIRMEWIDPEGKEHFIYEKYTHHKILAKHLPWWSYIHVKDNRENIIPGDWRVEVFIDREKVLTRKFLISEDMT